MKSLAPMDKEETTASVEGQGQYFKSDKKHHACKNRKNDEGNDNVVNDI